MKAIIIGLVLAAAGILIACQKRTFTGKKPAYKNISAAQLNQRLEKGDDIVLLDVRTPAEFTGPLGHLEGAVLIPLQELESRVGELDAYRDREIVAYCRSGNRSRTAAAILVRHDFRVSNLSGGMRAWNSFKKGATESPKRN